MGEQFHCRWALLSLSGIASLFVKDLLLPRDASDSITHEITCISTTGSPERAQTWMAEHKIPNAGKVQVYSSFEEMLQKGEFDVVYISTPHPLHYLHARTAINHGRNVLLEKPATMNRPQYERLIELAKQQNVVLMEAMWTRYLPATRYLQKHLLPKIGPVKRVFSDLSVPIASPELPLSSRLLDKNAGAGALLDMGVYALTWVDVALGQNNQHQVLHSSTIPYNTGKDLIDDVNTVILGDPVAPSSVGIVTTSLSIPGSNKAGDKLAVKKVAPAVRIEAANAQVSIPFPLIRPQELHIEWYGAEDVDAQGFERVEDVSKPVERGWGLWYQADVIARVVRDQPRGGKGVVIQEQESLRVLSWLDEARRLAGVRYADDLEAV